MDFNIIADIAATISAINNWWRFSAFIIIVSLLAWVSWLYLRPPGKCDDRIRSYAFMLLTDINNMINDLEIQRELLEQRIEITCEYIEQFYPSVSTEPVREQLNQFNRALAAAGRKAVVDTGQLKQALHDLRQKL